MTKYSTTQLTREEYDLIDRIMLMLMKKGLPMQIFGDQDLNEYLTSVDRKGHLSKGAITGIGLKALLYMMENKKVG